jgi:hypothetical protein
MEQFITGMPKFKSAEEELAFLREHVAKREYSLRQEGTPQKGEDITADVLEEYGDTEIEAVLHPDMTLPELKQEQIVLRLKPEDHDKNIEELLGILMEHGIKNALAVLEKMNNPHLDDDFHRFLVQFMHSGQLLADLKKETPLWKTLNMTLFEVTLPDLEEKEGAKGFKEFIGAMEQFYSGMLSVSSDRLNKEGRYFVIEVALSHDSEQVVVYVSVPNNSIDLFEKQILAFYHNAKVREVTDDYNIFTPGGASAGARATFSGRDIFPIKMHDKIDHDPIHPILNAFSKLKRIGEGASLQFIFVPRDDEYMVQFTNVMKDVKAGLAVSTAYEKNRGFAGGMKHILKDMVFGAQTDQQKELAQKYNDNASEKITEKIASPILATNIRIVASAETIERATSIVHEIEASFNQFTEPNSNSIVFEFIKSKDISHFLRDFSYRQYEPDFALAMNTKELASIFHFPVAKSNSPQLKQARAGIGPAPLDIPREGVLVGYNDYRGVRTPIHLAREDRMRHLYVVGQTGTGKTSILKNLIYQDIMNGDGCCYIDPHGTDVQDILSYIPKERLDDVIYFDPAYTARPMGLNMLEFDPNYPEQKTLVVNDMMAIFNQLFDMKTGGGPMFEQYFKNSAFLVMEHPESGSTLMEVTRVLADKAFRDMKLSHCKNPIIKQFWMSAEQTTGDQGLANFVPYISSKFDNFISNDIMRPVVTQEHSAFNFRKIMDEKKILLVNLSKGRLGEINANLIGLVLVGKIQMAALSRVDMYGQKMSDFYLYIDEFQNVTTPAIASILSEARKYRLSLNVAHQYIGQLPEEIKNAVFGNVGSMAVFRISPDDAKYLEPKFTPTFTASDITKLENRNAYVQMIVNGSPSEKPFNIVTADNPKTSFETVDKIKQLSYLKYGRDRAEVEEELLAKFKSLK